MHWRMYHYFGAIQQRWPEAEVIQVLIYLGNGPMTMLSSIDRPPRCQFRYDIIDMRDVPARVFLRSPKTAERALAVVSRSKDPRATIRKILGSWKGLPEKELQENFDRLRILSQLRNSEIMAKEEVERMPFDLDYRESEIYKLAGLEATRRMLSNLIQARFGPLSRTVRSRVKQADAEQIERWAKQFAVARTVSEVFQ